MELKGLKINFLGDSITEGYGCSCEEKCFVRLIAAMTGAITRNYGIGGTRIAHQTQPSLDPRCDRDFILRVDDMDADADVVVVFGGTNDFGHGDAPFGAPEDSTADTFCGALHVLYTRLIEKYPAAEIIVVTPLHRGDENAPNAHGKLLSDYAAAIRSAAAHYSLPVLDMWAVSGMQPALPLVKEALMPDGLHPNDAGHVKLASRIIACLKGL